MPFFSVTKGQDAFVEYVAIVEADNAEHARHQAESWEFSGHWQPNGNISEFDHSEVFEHSVQQVEAESLEEAEAKLAKAYPDLTDLLLDMTEHDTILAALRFYQAHLPSVSNDIMQIATHGGAHQALDVDAIEDLCVAINRAQRGPRRSAHSVSP